MIQVSKGLGEDGAIFNFVCNAKAYFRRDRRYLPDKREGEGSEIELTEKNYNRHLIRTFRFRPLQTFRFPIPLVRGMTVPEGSRLVHCREGTINVGTKGGRRKKRHVG